MYVNDTFNAVIKNLRKKKKSKSSQYQKGGKLKTIRFIYICAHDKMGNSQPNINVLMISRQYTNFQESLISFYIQNSIPPIKTANFLCKKTQKRKSS